MSSETNQDRIVFNPEILTGKAIIKGTRISVEFVLELLSSNWTYEEILKNYPHLTMEDILACLSYAKEKIKEEKVYPIKA